MEKCKYCKYFATYNTGEKVCTNHSSPNYARHIDDVKKCSDNASEDSQVEHPNHYNGRQFECWDEMEAVFGKSELIIFCKLNVWKYRYRAGLKCDIQEDMKKADFYMAKLFKLQEEMEDEYFD